VNNGMDSFITVDTSPSGGWYGFSHH